MRDKHIRVSENMYAVISYAQRKLQKNARLNELPSLPKVTKIIAEESIVDGDIIIFKIPNGNPISLKQRIRKA